MKLLLCLCMTVAAVAVVSAAPARAVNYNFSDDDDVLVLRYLNDNDGTGNYQYGYELSDGTRQEQRGELKNKGREDESLVVQGFFSWIAPNGIQYNTTYTVDAEHGYQPETEEGPGACLPAHILGSVCG